jgi:hypothetical protein
MQAGAEDEVTLQEGSGSSEKIEDFIHGKSEG